MIDNRYALLFIRGEYPIMDEKYELLNHPNVKYTTDGKGKPYEHGGTENAVATLTIADVDLSGLPVIELDETQYELISDEEMEALTI